MSKKKVLIIGAGISGLSSGCYAQMNGYDSEIFEMHSLSGGLCTAWKRKDYMMDGCIHWLVGTDPNSEIGRYWREVGALKGRKVLQNEFFTHYEDQSGRILTVYNDLDQFEKHMLEIAPEDRAGILEITETARKLAEFPIHSDKPMELYTSMEKLKFGMKMASYGRYLSKYTKISIKQHMEENISNLFLREALCHIIPQDLVMFAFLLQMAWRNQKNTGFPEGGSLAFAQDIEKRYRELGGTLHFNTKVEEVLIEDGRAVGIRLLDGREIRGDAVIASISGYNTYFKLLKGRYLDDKIKQLYSNTAPYQTHTSLQVSIGVNHDLSAEPHTVVVKLDKPGQIGDRVYEYLMYKHFCYDKTLAPQGKSVVTVLLDTSYDYWKVLYGDKERYKSEKKKVAEFVLEQFGKRFPEAAGKIEVTDVVTPVTYERYADEWRGTYMPWRTSPEIGGLMKLPKTIPALEGFYMVGQWTSPPGGLPSTVESARHSIQFLCKSDNKEFVAS